MPSPNEAGPGRRRASSARRVDPAQVLPDSLDGPGLIQAVRTHAAPVYVVTGRDGAAFGVLHATDLANVLTRR